VKLHDSWSAGVGPVTTATAYLITPRRASSTPPTAAPTIATTHGQMSASSIHAEPPPEIVRDAEGIQYETGAQLGKGGFAICHRAKLTGRPYLKEQRTVALKIVRSKMEPPKLAQKVQPDCTYRRDLC
jgi:hypothetical protein